MKCSMDLVGFCSCVCPCVCRAREGGRKESYSHSWICPICGIKEICEQERERERGKKREGEGKGTKGKGLVLEGCE